MHRLLAFIAFTLGTAAFINVGSAAAAPRPHVVYLLADDLGWSDVGWHNGDLHTPNLDKLAAGGARLEQFYVQPVCSPTRAAFLTGRYPMRHGLQIGVVRPHAQYGLPLDERTLPQALKETGYSTAIVGKWHLGHFERAYLPTQRGFDRQYGHYNGALDYFTHERDGGHDWHRDDKVNRDEGYSTELLGREAVRIIEQHDASKPLFLYVPFNAPHSPMQAPKSYLDRYTKITDEKRRAFAAMVHCLDDQVGLIVAALEKKGIAKNTLTLFSSDNGGPLNLGATNGPLRGEKTTLYEGGVRVPALANWPGRIAAGTVVNAPLHMVDWYPTLVTLAGGSLKQKHALDGRDAWAAIAQGKPSPHDDILLNTTPYTGAIRAGDWKLILNGRVNSNDLKQKNKKKGAEELVELFNLANDPYEKTNLAAEQPQKVKELRARLDAYARTAVPPKAEDAPAGFKSPKVWGEFEAK
jgi:arylsulfatase A-like enzyme